MQIPRFWAESRARSRAGGRQVTVRRFGWSDASEADAQAVADRRAAEALARLLAGERVERRERKVPYNGADGLPIREEVLSRHGDAVLTRNGYGAVCLNTPNVLFVDMDATGPNPTVAGCLPPVLVVAGAVAAGVWAASVWPCVVIALAGLFLLALVSAATDRRRSARTEERWAADALRRVAAFAEARPEWHLRLYRTPAGFRVLALHRTFDPASEEVADCFRELGADPQYVGMCRLQRCFRARVSPKPWRIGVSDHLRPRPGVWPVAPEYLPTRAAWVARYDAAARDYAACRFVEAFGGGRVDPVAGAVRRLHDELCRAESGLPIA